VTETKPATTATAAVNRQAQADYDLADRDDFGDADRGFIAPIPGGRTVNDAGKVVYDGSIYDYITDEDPNPDTVNPALWRQAQIMRRAGLYKVVDRLYQVRNTSVANVTIVEGDDGLIIIDTATSVETARQALELFREHVADKPVVAVIYTHTHVDHYAGIKGVVDPADVASGKVPIIAPGTIKSFDRHALGENIIVGNAMSRRASYPFSGLLDPGPRGFVTCGIGCGLNHNETITYISPTDPITETGAVRHISGLTFEFLYAPDTEAPEELHIWIPELKAVSCAENANHGMHNIQTLRGAGTRDARNFARYIDETLVRWGDQAEVHYGPHNWPVFGNENVVAFLESQRDTYKFIHDQALRLANKGLHPTEAAEQIKLPKTLGSKWFNRYYHGTLHHNVRAVFAKELGFWDGDPASLFPLTPVDNATRHVELIGADRILAEGRRAIDAADYRWAVQILHHLVFAQPDHAEARQLMADAYEQLGYQMEGPQWRGIFLSAAMELRQGVDMSTMGTSAAYDSVLAMPTDLLFDFAAVHVIGDIAADVDIRINISIDETSEEWTLWVRNGVLNARPAHVPEATLTVSGDKTAIATLLLAPTAATKLINSGALKTVGDVRVLDSLAAVMDRFDPAFNLVTP
jgi:alkyl sulfatase BDS1-like metallo-beta-lactamase superfamily hydrolase